MSDSEVPFVEVNDVEVNEDCSAHTNTQTTSAMSVVGRETNSGVFQYVFVLIVGLSKRRRDKRRDTCCRLPRERLPYRNIVQSEQHNILQE